MHLYPIKNRLPSFFFFSLLVGFFHLLLSQPYVHAEGVIKIGLLEEPKTLNIWLARDAWSHKVLSQLYQPLFIRHPKTLKPLPWLAAEDPAHDPAKNAYTIKLRAAKWSDGSDVTSEDVAFTGNFIKRFKVPRFMSNWEFIERIETPDKKTVKFFLREPRAIFLTRTLLTPIVQKKAWSKVADLAGSKEKPLRHLFNYRVQRPISSGPFVLKEWKQGAYLFLEKNKNFFGLGKEIVGYRLGPHINGIIFKIFGTTDAAVLALRKGSIDMFWWGLQPGYLQDLMEDEKIKIFTSEKSALYYLGFNLRKRPFNDINFRKAVALMVDKDFIIKRILQGYAVKMHSIVPPGNRFWLCPDLPGYGEGLSRDKRIRLAHKILKEAGYDWKVPPVNARGKVVKGKEITLPDGRPMKRFTILTPPADYDPHRAMVGIMVQEWLRMLGIPAYSKPMPLGSLVHHVNGLHQFDLFVLGYGQLSLDPDYLRNFFNSKNDRRKGWNTSGYRNPDFDRMADESARAIDLKRRQTLIWEMQRTIMRDIPFIPLYCPKLTEAVRVERFKGWIKMIGGIGNTWSFCQLKPRIR